jgi:hypothetical protein
MDLETAERLHDRLQSAIDLLHETRDVIRVSLGDSKKCLNFCGVIEVIITELEEEIDNIVVDAKV